MANRAKYATLHASMPIFGSHAPRKPDPLAEARELMVTRHLEARGIGDPRVLRAFRQVRREAFVDPGLAPSAYEDRPLAIGGGQTNSQPYVVALMASMLGLADSDHVLEIGAGSGYACAIFAALARDVVGIERVAGLAVRARENLRQAGIPNVVIRTGDGTRDPDDGVMFDAIAVSAGGPSVPPSLLRRLAPGGRLVMPVGSDPDRQVLVTITRAEDGTLRTHVGPGVHFVPLVGDEGWPEISRT
ncbi:MAG: protein-L-isoaspartate(D-aspartate) O-methyltransferase [Polyangiaceae bacterium]